MLGNMVGPRGCLVGLFILTLSCAHNVPQDSSTGSDGKDKGAKLITLENGEGKAAGIVTYPGSDRIDWRLIELPEKQRGTLELKLAWTPPRPGLQLAFDVFDEWNQPVVQSAKTSRKRSTSRVRTATVENAKGKYKVRIYALGRGDAGKYRLSVEFKEKASGPAIDYGKLEVPDPPKLAALPEILLPCDPFQFDPKNPACKSVCPEVGAPPGWPACAGRCPNPPNPELQACKDTMPCGNPPNREIKACTKSKFPKCPDPKAPDPANPNCDGIKVPPVVGRIIGNTVSGSDLIITIGVGTNKGVAADWRGTVLRGEGDQPLSSGEVTVIRVDKAITVGKVRLTTDQLSSNSRVRLSAP
jgi:hypothetical protein